jgi:beta-lactamase class D
VHHAEMRWLSVLLSFAFCLTTAGGATQKASPRGRVECFVFARAGDAPYVSDRKECGRATAPASTFKIPHALIALEAGVITPETIFKWDGTPKTNKSWQRDHTLASAIQWSVLPYFQNTARQLGRERMQRGLATLRYAADTFERDVDAFWLYGDLVVTPIEQFAFVERLVLGTLPTSRVHMSTVMEAMRMPPGQVLMAARAHPFALTWPPETVVRTKTGNTTVEGERVSWLIGALELRGAHHVFAARVRFAGTLPGAAGADLALRELNSRAPSR